MEEAGLEACLTLRRGFRAEIGIARIVRDGTRRTLQHRSRGKRRELVECTGCFPGLSDCRAQLERIHPLRQETVLGHDPCDVSLGILLEAVVVAERGVAVDA